MGALVSVQDNGKELVVYPSGGSGPSFSVKTIHISCKSDTFLGPHHKYGGIIVYGRNGETDWFTANGTHCKSGYIVIMRTDTTEFEDLQRRWDEPGQVHGVIYRKAFGESCKYKNVVGEGFGIINGELKIISGAFNLAKRNDMYHDDSVYMNSESARYVGLVVLLWKLHSFPGKQTYSVEELSKCKCTIL